MAENNTSTTDTSTAQLMAELERLKAENAKLKANNESVGTGIKVSEKGGVSVYGLGRFPVTLYAEQWTKIFAMRDKIETFIRDNQHALSHKSRGEVKSV